MTSLRGTTIFVDDIRAEANGKLILVGVYTADIAIPLETYVVPRLYILYSIEGDHSERHSSMLFETTFPGEEPKKLDIPLNWSTPLEDVPADRARWQLKAYMDAGFTTLRHGPIRTVVTYGEEQIVLTPWWIQFSPNDPTALTEGTAGSSG